jgi:hypothetical protein
MNGRDTHTLRITRQLKEEILRGCDQPDILRAIFEQAWGLAFGRGTVDEFDQFCRAQPCIKWNPDDPSERHVTVDVSGEREKILIAVHRVVWTIVHTVSAQGPTLMGDQELLHSCGNNGTPNTGFGVCLNPAHLIVGTQDNRVALRQARKVLRRLNANTMAG